MVTRTLTRGTSLGRGAVLGAFACLLGYLGTWVLAGARVAELGDDGLFGGRVPAWKAVLWLFYDSHFVGTRLPAVYGPGGDLLFRSELVDTVGVLDAGYLYAVPVLLLFLAGAAVALLVGTTGPLDGLLVGASVTAGYLVVVVLGLFVATQGGVAPNPLRALVFAGIVYPVAFGAVGGATAGLFGRNATERTVEPAVR